MLDAQAQLVGGGRGCVPMRKVRAGKAMLRAQFALGALTTMPVGSAAGTAARDDTRGHGWTSA